MPYTRLPELRARVGGHPADVGELSRETRLTNLRMAAGFTSPELNAPCTHILHVGRHYRRAPAASCYSLSWRVD